ncbi:hypothetical protein [Enterococcus sp. AZ177]|uniref:hypothetical protein n=1 Tax=unclassified Enterococcus TaxID=2608891 RepID=UPI003D2FD3B8
MSKVNCIQADWQQDVSAIAGLNAGGGAADSIATLIKDSFDIITDAEDTISRYDNDGEINSVFDTDSVGKYQLASFPTLTETLHKYSKNAPISIQNDIDLPFNMKLDDFLGAMSNVDIKGYSTAATGSLAKSGNFSTGQSGIVTLKDLLEPATPLGKQLKREYIEFKKQIGDDFTYEEYQMMAMNLASYDYDSFLEALAKGTAAFALTVAVTSIPVIGPIISLGMSGVGALEGFWGAATGNSLLTGRKLSGEEKVLSGLFGAMNLAFAGLTAYNSFFKGKVKIPSKKASELDVAEETVTYRRVQGGQGNKSSQDRIVVDNDGNIFINKKDRDLNISIDDGEHARHFIENNRPGADLIEIEVPKWFDDFVKENMIPQAGSKTNPANQGGTVPKLTDPTTPGVSVEFPPPWAEWIEEVAISSKIIKGGK